jgi:DMSO/TMAO reductase YedYZ molybdopterin-dependent catalytic subunit
MAMTGIEQPGLIVRQKHPLNLEYPFATLSSYLTPVDQFYVRNHFSMPSLERGPFRLDVCGAVARTLSLSLDDLRRMPRVEFTAVMECAGNGRVFYEPAREGLQWQNGAVGNARWSGVPLAAVLNAAGIGAAACEVVLIGADQGKVDDGKKTASPGPIAFARSLPLAKARSSDVILADSMNGEPLTLEHGAPLRAVVGGWYGMAWVKWLAALRVVERPFAGYWQTRDYFRWDRSLGEPTLAPLDRMEVKAQIARPVSGTRLRAGTPVTIMGAAWSGEATIEAVEVSIEGTEPLDWTPARLLAPDAPHGWVMWEFTWTPASPGTALLRCRARDARGNVQPEGQQPDRESYGANWIVPVPVSVSPADAALPDDFVI